MQLVLLPGWGFDARIWQPVVDRLPVGLQPCFDLAGVREGAIVCGWSLGATRALDWAARHPERRVRLLLVGATPRFVQASDWPTAQPARLLEEFAAGVAADLPATLRRFTLLLNRGDSQSRARVRAMAALQAGSEQTAATLLAGLAELRDTDLRATVPTIRQPALVIHGARDPLMPLAAGRWLASHLPAAELSVFAEAAHAPFFADPRRFVDLLNRFADG